MALQVRLDLRKLVPKSLRPAARKAGETLEKPLGAAETVLYPQYLLEDAGDKVQYARTLGRLKRCTIPTRVHVTGIADIPALGFERAGSLSVVLLRLRVERPEGEVETCLRTHMPPEIRRFAVGSSLRALAHDEDPRIVVVDWRACGEALGMELSTTNHAAQYAWPDEEEWPAAGALEVRDGARHRRRVEKQRSEWTPATAHLLNASTRGARLDDREQWTLDLDLGQRAVTTKERVPDLALARLVGYRRGEESLGGVVTKVETVVNEGAPLSVLVSADGEVAVDWEATLNRPEYAA